MTYKELNVSQIVDLCNAIIEIALDSPIKQKSGIWETEQAETIIDYAKEVIKVTERNMKDE